MTVFKDITFAQVQQDRFDVIVQLSERPPDKWANIFNDLWRTPFYHMWHVAHAKDGIITIRACTLEEYHRYHRDMLERTVTQANEKYKS